MKFKSSLLAIAAALFMQTAHAATCSLSDVVIEGVSAQSCSGMFSGNFNELSDINDVLGSSYIQYDAITTNVSELSAFSFSTSYHNIVEIVLKQNTTWASYKFDLSLLDSGSDGLWNGVWSTAGSNWDGKVDIAGCQGCGDLSHAALLSYGSEVPVPGTLALLSLGLLSLGFLRNKNSV